MLDILGLSHSYANGTVALDDVNLSLGKGMFGLLGPNGAGKSTLMRTVATLQTPTAGSIRFDGIDVLANPSDLRRTLGYLPQDFGVYPRVGAKDLLDHMAALKGIGGRENRNVAVETLLRKVNLWDARSKPVAGYSGGMRQRFGIAQALLGNPSLIIVDEPTAGLDPEERNRFLNILAEISDDIVVILSTHIVQDVADLCPRMAVLAGGRIILEGAPQALIADTQARLWAKTVDRAAVGSVRERHNVISTRLIAGRHLVHILSDDDPGEGFGRARGGLEEVYFSTLASTRRQS